MDEAPRMLNKSGPMAYALCFSTADKSHFNFMPSFAVTSFDSAPAGLISFAVPSGTYLVATYIGPAQGIGDFRYTLTSQYWPTSPHQRLNAPNIEVYKPDYDPGDAKGTMELWTPIKPVD